MPTRSPDSDSVPGAAPPWRSLPPADPVEATLLALLEAAAAPAVDRFRAPLRTRQKADGSLVTAVDREAERILQSGLADAFPDHGQHGEEGARRPAAPGAPTWYIDPLDGTGAWLEGLAHWGPVVTAIDAQGVVCGALLLPRLDEFWTFHRDHGAHCNRAPLPARASELVPPTRPLLAGGAMLQHLRIRWRGRLRNLGSTAAHLAMVAAGGASAALVGPGWGTWDTALGLALIGASGGASACLASAPPETESPTDTDRDAPSRGAPVPPPMRVDPLRDVGQPFVAGAPDAVARLLRPGSLRPHHDPS